MQRLRVRNRRLSPGSSVLRSKLHAPLRRWLALVTLVSLAAPWVLIRASGMRTGHALPIALAANGLIVAVCVGLLRSVTRADARMRALIDS